jgi:hypothetical protein
MKTFEKFFVYFKNNKKKVHAKLVGIFDEINVKGSVYGAFDGAQSNYSQSLNTQFERENKNTEFCKLVFDFFHIL